MRKFATIFAAAAMSAVLVFGQGQGMGRGNNQGAPPDPQTMVQKRVDRLATLLNLTDAQKAQATTIFTNALTASQSIHPNMRTARESLAAAVKKDDVASIDSLSAAIGTLMGQLTAVESKASAAFYALLTADQQAKFDAMHGGWGGPGMGGPGGPGMMGRNGWSPRARQQ